MTRHPPSASREEFIATVHGLVAEFPGNRLCRLIDSGGFNLRHYHAWLNIIFHQTFEGPSTFAMAAGQCDPRRHQIRDYLIEHAEEERTHWQWVIDDLQATGFQASDPRFRFAHAATQNYLAFNAYCCLRRPEARLASAAFLEGVGAAHGKNYGLKICALIGLKPQQAKFLFGHGDTDVGHTADIFRVLGDADLSGYEWAWMVHAAQTAASLYGAMYDAAAE